MKVFSLYLFRIAGFYLVKKKFAGYVKRLDLTITYWENLKRHEEALRRAVTSCEEIELPLIDTKNKMVKVELFQGKWWVSIKSYHSKTRAILEAYTMNLLPEELFALYNQKDVIDFLIVHFREKKRKKRFSALGPKIEVQSKVLKEREFITFSWRHLNRNTGEILRHGVDGFWFKDLALAVGHFALPDDQIDSVKIETPKMVSDMPDLFELTRQVANVLVYLHVRQTNGIGPCSVCEDNCSENVIFPCDKCFVSDIPKCRFWRVENSLRELLKSYAFRSALTDILEFIRKNVCPLSMYGKDLAAAYLAFVNYRDVKLAFWNFLSENASNSILSNLRHCIILVADEKAKQRKRRAEDLTSQVGTPLALSRKKIQKTN